MAKKIVVVAPTYNEEENIAAFVKAVSRYDVDLLISDSHSTDRTKEIITQLQKQNKRLFYLDVQKRGLGLGLSRGLDFAVEQLGADVLVTMEADLSNDVTKLPEFIKELNGTDLVVGSRYARGGGVRNWSWWRRGISLVANLTLSILSLTFNLREFTNLYRVFTKEVWLKLSPKVSVYKDWLFVPAFIFEALAANLKIKERPYIFTDRFGGRSKMNTPGYTKDLLRYAIRYRLKKSSAFFKFLAVGTVGFVINTAILEAGIKVGLPAWVSGPLGAEAAIVSNFTWNNLWTFSENKIAGARQILLKFFQFNILSFGSLVIQGISLFLGEVLTRDLYYQPIVNAPYLTVFSWYRLFYVLGVALGLVWNFVMYSKVIWRKKTGSG